MASKVSGMIEKIKIGTTSRAIASTAYGYCETAAATQIKDVDMTGFVLYEGVTVHIKFANANSADNPKLRINSTAAGDAKPIVQYGTTAAGKTSDTNGWYAGAVISFTYDGTSWVRDQGFNTNSWRGIQDNLTSSDDTTQSLSAKQGYLLANGSARDSTKLPLAGGTMTGVLTALGSQYTDSYSGALNMNNSNIYGLTSIYTADASDNAAEGIHFYRDSTHVDSLWMNGGALLFVPNRALGTSTTRANSEKVLRGPASITDGYVFAANSTDGLTKQIEATNANTASTIVQRDASGNFSAGTITASLTGDVTGNCSGSSGSCTGNAKTATQFSSNATVTLTGDTTGVSAGSKKSWSITTTTTKISQTSTSALSSFTDTNAFMVTAAGGNNSVTDKPTGVDAFGCFTYKTADGWYGQLLTSSNASTGLYWRTATTLSGGWKKVLDSNNTSAADSNGADISVSWNTSTKIATINGVDVKIKIPSNPNTNTTYTFTDGTAGNFKVTPSEGSAQTVSIGKPSTAGTADKATAANITNGTTTNAIAYYTNASGTFGTLASSSGALYATSNNGALSFGILPIAQGGIGSATASPHYVLAGPTSGSTAGAPSWRTLVEDDIPNLNTSKLNAGTLGIARGGTGKNTWVAYSLPYASAANTLGELTANTTTTKKFLMMQGNGSAVESFGWSTVTKTDVGLSNVTNDAQVKASLGSAVGDMVYWSAASTPARLAIGTVGQILKVVKNSNNELVPQWGAAPETYPSGGSAGQCLAKTSSGVGWSDGTKKTADTSTLYYVCGSSSDSTNYNGLIFNTNVYVSSNVLFGAAWNDYAEYRECTQIIEPGRCIVENGDGTLSLSTQRLQGGAEIVSDTFGFAIGKTTKCKTPIAVSGRVLAYINEPIEQIKIGSPVCSGPNGTVSQMTSFEARKYPWLIIGTISAIPQEEFWGEAKVSTKNRIWIRIR